MHAYIHVCKHGICTYVCTQELSAKNQVARQPIARPSSISLGALSGSNKHLRQLNSCALHASLLGIVLPGYTVSPTVQGGQFP